MNHALLSDLVLGLAACCYFVATLGFTTHLAKRGGSKSASAISRQLMGAGVALHAVYIVYISAVQHVCPVKTIHYGLSLGGLTAALLYLLVRKFLKIYGIGVFVSCIALIFIIAGRFFPIHQVSSGLQSGLLPLHVAANVLGDACFVIASGAAATYLFQERQLKAKKGSSVFGRLPPIDTLDRTAHIFLVAGFLLATIGAATGTIWVAKLHIGKTTEILRVLLGYATWSVVSAVLLLRATLGWRGRRAAYGTLVGFALAMIVVLLYFVGGRS